MPRTPYLWRKLSPTQRAEVLAYRQRLGRPWHRPPHFDGGEIHYHLSAACYEHHPHVGRDPERLASFSEALLEAFPTPPSAWCVLPNHYHVLIRTNELHGLVHKLSRLHGRTSFQWNREEQIRGRKVWHGASDRAIRSGGHFWATLNYIHNNPVHHGYVERWTDWPFSSADAYLSEVGREHASELWRTHPLGDFGAGWDDPAM